MEGLQDLGAGGITCATSETADRAGPGSLVDLDAIPRREPGMEPFEVMISESQERMCAAVRPDRWEAVREVCVRWGLPVAIIGRITADGDIAIVTGGLDADGGPPTAPSSSAGCPAAALTSDAIVHRRVAGRADPLAGRARAGRLRRGARIDSRSAGWTRAPSCSACSARPTSRRATAVFTPVRLHGRGRHGRRSRSRCRRPAGQGHDQGPRRHDGRQPGRRGAAIRGWGAALSVAEATRNVSITGARPLGVTNCLNYGDPTRPEAFWQLTEGVRGLGRRVPWPSACRSPAATSRSTTSRRPGAIAPTPEIGVVGLIDDIEHARRTGLRHGGDVVALVGETSPGLGGIGLRRPSPVPALEDGLPDLDLARERALQAFIREAIARGLVAVGAGRVRRWARRRPRRRRDVGRPRGAACDSRSGTRRPSTCSVRARRASS